MQLVIVIILILAILLAIFTLQNTLDITLNIFFWEISDAPLVLVLICCITLGYIIAAIYFYPKLWKTKREYNQLIKFHEELKELHELDHSINTEETNPEGVELDDDDDDDSFFKD